MVRHILNLPLPREAWLMPPESDYEELRAVYYSVPDGSGDANGS